MSVPLPCPAGCSRCSLAGVGSGWLWGEVGAGAGWSLGPGGRQRTALEKSLSRQPGLWPSPTWRLKAQPPVLSPSLAQDQTGRGLRKGTESQETYWR